MSAVAPLFAARDDWVGLLVIILFVVIPAITQLFAKMRQRQKPADKPPGQPAEPPAGGELEDEIGDFLRRAVRRGGAGEAGKAGAERPVEAQVVPAEPVGGKVQKHVGEYLNSETFTRRAAELGDEVAHSDQRMGLHLEEVFEHEVSRLAGTPGETAGAPAVAAATREGRVAGLPSTAAAGLPALLSNAASIRQAIVISEILQRPEHRWT